MKPISNFLVLAMIASVASLLFALSAHVWMSAFERWQKAMDMRRAACWLRNHSKPSKRGADDNA